MIQYSQEIQQKLKIVRSIFSQSEIGGIRFRGSDWFSWITAGGSNSVLLTSETGIAEVFVTDNKVWVLTDTIEAERLKNEEVPIDFEIWERPWAESKLIEEFIQDHSRGRVIASDRPQENEVPLPNDLIAAKRRMLPEEAERYRELAKDASQAMTETLRSARPEWSEFDLASVGSKNLWKRGIHPALTLAASCERISLYRHPVPTRAKLGRRGMLVFCARRNGLFANLTRFVYFEEPSHQEQKIKMQLVQIESEILQLTRPGLKLDTAYACLAKSYEKQGFSKEILRHHQGGLTGYLAREVIATPASATSIEEGNAVAWNPSLPGSKIEDTVLVSKNKQSIDQLEILTLDPNWPSFEYENYIRPDFLLKP